MSVRKHVKIARTAGGPVAFLAVLCIIVAAVFFSLDALAGVVFLAAGIASVAAFFIVAEITATNDEMTPVRADTPVDRRRHRR